jgi:hypothetical protein
MPLYKNCGRWKNFNCVFGFSVKSYVRNTTNLSWDKILLTSVIEGDSELTCDLFKDAVINTSHLANKGKLTVIDKLQIFRNKRSWPRLHSYHLAIYLEWLRKTIKTLVTVSGVVVDIMTGRLPNGILDSYIWDPINAMF